MKVTELVNENDEFTTTRYVLYINGKPAAHYANENEAQDQMREVLKSMKKNHPNYTAPKMEIRKKQISNI